MSKWEDIERQPGFMISFKSPQVPQPQAPQPTYMNAPGQTVLLPPKSDKPTACVQPNQAFESPTRTSKRKRSRDNEIEDVVEVATPEDDRYVKAAPVKKTCLPDDLSANAATSVAEAAAASVFPSTLDGRISNIEAARLLNSDSAVMHGPISHGTSGNSSDRRRILELSPSFNASLDTRRRPDGGHDQSSGANSVDGLDEDNLDCQSLTINQDFDVVPNDEPDRQSLWSITMIKSRRYYCQHPYLRIFIAYIIVLMNFLMTAEDPIAHSVVEANIPVLGNAFSLVFNNYPEGAGYVALKVMYWLLAIVLGVVIGKFFFHQLIFGSCLRLKMFRDCQGSWMVMFFTTIASMCAVSFAYNATLHTIDEDVFELFGVTKYLQISNEVFVKAASTGTWLGDFITAWMVTDMMLQDHTNYSSLFKFGRRYWRRPWIRISLFWVVAIGMSAIVIIVISADIIAWDTFNMGIGSSELARAFLASTIFLFDLLIVMQDWEFPHFTNTFDVKLPGVNTATIDIKLPSFLKKEITLVKITGKWFNYGILIIVMMLDLNMWKNQVVYEPYAFGQYTGPNNMIYTVLDPEQIARYDETQLTYRYRNATLDPATQRPLILSDILMNSRYIGYSLPVKLVTFIPAIVGYLLFFCLVIFYGRFAADDPAIQRHRYRRRNTMARFSSSFRRGTYNVARLHQLAPEPAAPPDTGTVQMESAI